MGEMAIRKAKHEAKKLLEKYGICSPEDIRIEDIAWLCGAQVSVGPLHHAAARITITDKNAQIRVRENDDEGRIRFSIGHELGHLTLHKNKIQSFKACSEIDLLQWSENAEQEYEANTFSSELLLPSFMMTKKCDVAEVNLDHVKSIANEFRTSLTATALKFVELCPEACAVLMSNKDGILWWRKNDEFPFGLKKNEEVRKGTLTFDVFHERTVTLEPECVWASAWLKNSQLDRDAEIIEHVVPMPNLGIALTLLWYRP